jgi:hypothetical protein
MSEYFSRETDSPEVTMNQRSILAYAAAVSLGMGIAFAGIVTSRPAHAQYVYACPPGYYYDPTYGCVPAAYLYGPPYYAYPDFGFDFFYGGGWGGGYRGHPGGVPHGGTAPHGGGHGPH